jgi:hypothetical protein
MTSSRSNAIVRQPQVAYVSLLGSVNGTREAYRPTLTHPDLMCPFRALPASDAGCLVDEKTSDLRVCGAGGRIRTDDLPLTRRLLYP